jgi:predicted RNA-binding Zn-ribbon protein involved in translation (DUF1610 family)
LSLDRLMPLPPEGERVSVERAAVDLTCPKCGSTAVARYPIANYIGPRIVTKCQDCFHSLSVDVPTEEDRWPPWRAAARDWPSTRAG